jgi:hypothetical protein
MLVAAARRTAASEPCESEPCEIDDDERRDPHKEGEPRARQGMDLITTTPTIPTERSTAMRAKEWI